MLQKGALICNFVINTLVFSGKYSIHPHSPCAIPCPLPPLFKQKRQQAQHEVPQPRVDYHVPSLWRESKKGGWKGGGGKGGCTVRECVSEREYDERKCVCVSLSENEVGG